MSFITQWFVFAACLVLLRPAISVASGEADLERHQQKLEAAVREAKEARKEAEEAADAARDASRKAKNAESAFAPQSSGSPRTTHQFGVYGSVWGDPYPAVLGLNVAYNPTDFARVNVGIGTYDADNFKIETVGLGAKLFVPGWSLSPCVGINLSFTKSDNAGPRSVRGFDPSGATPYINAGIDLATGMGFTFGVGYLVPIRDLKNFKEGNSGSYYLNAGLFL